MNEVLSTDEIEILPTDEIEVLSGDVSEMTEASSNDDFEIEAADVAVVSEVELSDAEGRRRIATPRSQSGRRRGPGSMAAGAAGRRRLLSSAKRPRPVCRYSLNVPCDRDCPRGYREIQFRLPSYGCRGMKTCKRVLPCPIDL